MHTRLPDCLHFNKKNYLYSPAKKARCIFAVQNVVLFCLQTLPMFSSLSEVVALLRCDHTRLIRQILFLFYFSKNICKTIRSKKKGENKKTKQNKTNTNNILRWFFNLHTPHTPHPAHFPPPPQSAMCVPIHFPPYVNNFCVFFFSFSFLGALEKHLRLFFIKILPLYTPSPPS